MTLTLDQDSFHLDNDRGPDTYTYDSNIIILLWIVYSLCKKKRDMAIRKSQLKFDNSL